MTCRILLLFACLVACLQGLAASRDVQPGPGALARAVAAASPGDTLRILPGTYKEHDILIDKERLTLLGVNFPQIDGEHKSQILVITAPSVTIQGLHIAHTGRSSLTDMAAIRVQQTSGARIIGNKIMDATYAVYMENASHSVVHGNQIQAFGKDEQGSGNGVHAWKSSHLTVSSNHIRGHRDGIYFEFVTDSHITGNTSVGNVRYGLHFMFSHQDTYSRNLFADNGAGVAVMYSKQVVMTENTFRHNWGDAAYAMLLKEISDSRIERNLFEKNTVALHMEGTTRIQVLSNVFSANGWAIRVLANCEANNFERNNFLGNSFDVATNGTLVLNTFKQNFWDQYDGYDLDRDGLGDVPHHPVSVYSVITEKVPVAMILYRSFLSNVMNQAEKVMPSLIPDMLRDDTPVMKKWKL
jgi:nitrous oxidase accessory protein